MTQCKKLRGQHRQVCIGSMDKLITLKQRNIQRPGAGSVDYSELFTNIADVWAQVKTLARGEIFFDRTNVAQRESHIFGIRYRDDVTTETWVELDGDNYDVTRTEDLDEKNEFLLLYAIKKGDKNLAANQT